jgi:hypothetical protein
MIPSHLGGFTSKSNKCHKNYFTKLKCLMLIKRILSTHHLDFLINHKILTNRGWGELTKALDECIPWVAPAASKGGRGKAFILVPKN